MDKEDIIIFVLFAVAVMGLVTIIYFLSSEPQCTVTVMSTEGVW